MTNAPASASNTPHIPKPGLAPRSTTPLLMPVFAATPDANRVMMSYVGQRVLWRGLATAIVAIPPALCLAAVADASEVVVWESLWINYTPYLRTLAIKEGDALTFVTRVEKLLDGGYALNRPMQVQQVEA